MPKIKMQYFSCFETSFHKIFFYSFEIYFSLSILLLEKKELLVIDIFQLPFSFAE